MQRQMCDLNGRQSHMSYALDLNGIRLLSWIACDECRSSNKTQIHRNNKTIPKQFKMGRNRKKVATISVLFVFRFETRTKIIKDARAKNMNMYDDMENTRIKNWRNSMRRATNAPFEKLSKSTWTNQLLSQPSSLSSSGTQSN